MFIRQKKRGERIYLQIVENERIGPKVVQHVRATLGRLDILQETGKLDSLLRSGLRFSQKLLVLDAHKNGECTSVKRPITLSSAFYLFNMEFSSLSAGMIGYYFPSVLSSILPF